MCVLRFGRGSCGLWQNEWQGPFRNSAIPGWGEERGVAHDAASVGADKIDQRSFGQYLLDGYAEAVHGATCSVAIRLTRSLRIDDSEGGLVTLSSLKLHTRRAQFTKAVGHLSFAGEPWPTIESADPNATPLGWKGQECPPRECRLLPREGAIACARPCALETCYRPFGLPLQSNRSLAGGKSK